MSQGEKGVPIGGYISAQAAELWCLVKEHRFLSTSPLLANRESRKMRVENSEKWQASVDRELKKLR